MKLQDYLVLLSCLFAIPVSQAQNPGETFLDCEVCPEMVVIPAGQVTLGSHADEAYSTSRDRPKQRARIRENFAMAKTEVTLAQFRQFMTESNHQQQSMVYQGTTYVGCNYFDGKRYGYVQRHSWEDPGFPQNEESPVVCVSWSDATAYAQWLSEKTGRQYRVPSTVEFEYALRAGNDTPWPWGNNPDQACDHANIADRTFSGRYPSRPNFDCDDGYVFVARVAQFEANAFGLYDMIGNAWEWTDDCWHDDLSKAPLDGRAYLDRDDGDCDARTPKGGGWISGPGWSRAAARSKDGQHYRSYMLGFRVASALSKK